VVDDQRFDVAAAPNKPLARSLAVAFFLTLPTLVVGQSHDATAAHADPVTPVVLALAIILAAAKLGGHLAVRLGKPAVLGELVAALFLGSFDQIGIGWFRGIEADATSKFSRVSARSSSFSKSSADRSSTSPSSRQW
jgi:hypothetical protein